MKSNFQKLSRITEVHVGMNTSLSNEGFSGGYICIGYQTHLSIILCVLGRENRSQDGNSPPSNVLAYNCLISGCWLPGGPLVSWCFCLEPQEPQSLLMLPSLPRVWDKVWLRCNGAAQRYRRYDTCDQEFIMLGGGVVRRRRGREYQTCYVLHICILRVAWLPALHTRLQLISLAFKLPYFAWDNA